MANRTILSEVAWAYTVSRNTYDRAASRGDQETADNALSQMQEMERCITVIETSRAWRVKGN